MTSSTLLDLDAVAARCGLTYSTVRGYHGIATYRRRENASRPGDMPPPDHHFGRTPVWSTETIDQWRANLPGRGAGGGRPRKEPS